MKRISRTIRTKPETIFDFQNMFGEIYTPANQRYSDSDLILHLIEETCLVMELARKDDLEKMPKQLGRVFSWTNAVATRLKVNLQDALWYKYPNVCPYCLRPENCHCAVEHPNIPDKNTTLRRLRMEQKDMPITLRDHQNLHRRLYFKQNRRILVIQTAAHLAEEAGEISKEFRHRNFRKFCDEIADVQSWNFALANRIGFELTETVWEQFPFECESCHKLPCENLTGSYCNAVWEQN